MNYNDRENRNTVTAFDRYGQPVRGNVVPDGGIVKVPFMLTDSAPEPLSHYLSDTEMPGRRQASATDTASTMHRPGYLTVPVVDKAKSIANHIGRKQRLSDAWRNPDPSPVLLDGNTDHQARPQPTTIKATDAESAYAARNARLASAWK